MRDQIEAIKQLRNAVERTIGKTLETNKDFENLSNSIYDKTHVRISATTLKRIWGYLSENVTPRRYTLDQLARFIDYDSFDAFCASLETDKAPESDDSSVETEVTPCPQEDAATEDAPSAVTSFGEESSRAVAKEGSVSSPSKRLPPSLLGRGWVRGSLWVGLLAAAALLFFLLRPSTGTSADNDRILKKGQVFATYDDLLPLFGIDATESRHFQYVPGEEHIVVWSPQYHNPYYHNDGNPDSLMPTITEYYHPENWPTDSASMAQLAEMNKKGFLTALEKNQVRLCFMKDLVDTSFVFLGVYRVATTLSDTTKVVWVRATNECNLDNIAHLNKFRN